MTTKVIHQRTIEATGKGGKGRYVFTFELHSIGGMEPYFSVDGRDKLKAIIPGYSWFLDLHLCNASGIPMHCLSNAAYFLKALEYRNFQSHLKMSSDDLKEFIGMYAVASMDHTQQAQDIVKECLTFSSSLSLHASFNVRSYAMLKDVYTFLRSHNINEYLPVTNVSLRDKYNNLKKRIGKVISAAYYSDNRASACIVELRDLSVQYTKYYAGLSDRVAEKKDQQFLSNYIDRELKPRWLEQANKAIEFLQKDDIHLTTDESEIDEDTLWLEIDGEKVIIDESDLYEGGYLPMVDCGGEEYYLAEDSSDAGEAVRKYWTDLYTHDKHEFMALVGEETVLSWAYGESAGPGTIKVNSLDEWLDVVASHPIEQWASYDGEELKLSISPALAAHLQYDGHSAVAYRHN